MIISLGTNAHGADLHVLYGYRYINKYCIYRKAYSKCTCELFVYLAALVMFYRLPVKVISGCLGQKSFSLKNTLEWETILYDCVQSYKASKRYCSAKFFSQKAAERENLMKYGGIYHTPQETFWRSQKFFSLGKCATQRRGYTKEYDKT